MIIQFGTITIIHFDILEAVKLEFSALVLCYSDIFPFDETDIENGSTRLETVNKTELAKVQFGTEVESESESTESESVNVSIVEVNRLVCVGSRIVFLVRITVFFHLGLAPCESLDSNFSSDVGSGGPLVFVLEIEGEVIHLGFCIGQTEEHLCFTANAEVRSDIGAVAIGQFCVTLGRNAEVADAIVLVLQVLGKVQQSVRNIDTTVDAQS